MSDNPHIGSDSNHDDTNQRNEPSHNHNIRSASASDTQSNDSPHSSSRQTVDQPSTSQAQINQSERSRPTTAHKPGDNSPIHDVALSVLAFLRLCATTVGKGINAAYQWLQRWVRIVIMALNPTTTIRQTPVQPHSAQSTPTRRPTKQPQSTHLRHSIRSLSSAHSRHYDHPDDSLHSADSPQSDHSSSLTGTTRSEQDTHFVQRTRHTQPSSASPLLSRIYLIRRIAVIMALIAVVSIMAVSISWGIRATNHRDIANAKQSDSNTSQQASPLSRGSNIGNADSTGDTGRSPKDSTTTNTNESQTITVLEPLDDQTRADILAQAQQTAAASGKTQAQYTYCVSTKGDVSGGDISDDASSFENAIYRTLNNPLGWPRAGATFVQGTDGQCDMTIVLSQAQYMPTFSQDCSQEYSCRVGNDVIINKARWDHGTKSWLTAGGTLDRYRIMVINHEVGHRLGHIDNETACAGAGQPAPLMQQQSMGLEGCVANEWPLDSETWVSQ